MAEKFIEYFHEPNEIILEYHLRIDEIAEQDPTPLLRIFGDGTVNVHYPIYMKKAGDYYLQLSDQELEELISFLKDNGLFDFDAPQIRQLRNERLLDLQSESIETGSESVLFETHDAATSIFIYNVERYATDKDGITRVMPWRKKIKWHGLKTDAKKFPNIKEITGLAAIEIKLKNIADRDDLIKLGD